MWVFHTSPALVPDCLYRIEVTVAPVLLSPEVLAAHNAVIDNSLDATARCVAYCTDAAHVALDE